jgi:hypothetical protein
MALLGISPFPQPDLSRYLSAIFSENRFPLFGIML